MVDTVTGLMMVQARPPLGCAKSLAFCLDFVVVVPLSMGFSRQEYWSGLPFPSPGDLPDPGIKPVSLALAGRLFTTVPPGKPLCLHRRVLLTNC